MHRCGQGEAGGLGYQALVWTDPVSHAGTKSQNMYTFRQHAVLDVHMLDFYRSVQAQHHSTKTKEGINISMSP